MTTLARLEELRKEYLSIVGTEFIQQDLTEVAQVVDYIGDKRFSYYVDIGLARAGSVWLYANTICEPGATLLGIDVVVTEAALIILKVLKERGFTIDTIQRPAIRCVADVKDDIELLHIDAQHSYAAVSEEYWAYSRKVKDGGVVLLHDTMLHEGCIKFRQELENNKCNITTFGIEGKALGISVIQK